MAEETVEIPRCGGVVSFVLVVSTEYGRDIGVRVSSWNPLLDLGNRSSASDGDTLDAKVD